MAQSAKASAGTTGASYGVYVATGSSEQQLSLNDLGGTSSTVVPQTVNEVTVTAVNSTATLGVVSVFTDNPVGTTEIFTVPGNTIVGSLQIAALGYAMDPVNPNIAFAVDSRAGVDAIDLSTASSTLLATLPGATTIGVTPDGSHVIVGGFNSSSSFGFVDSVPTNGGAPATWAGSILGNRRIVDLTVAPDGSAVYATANSTTTGINPPSVVFRLPLAQFNPKTVPTWTDPTDHPIAITLARSCTVSRDGQTLYVAGLNPRGQSTIQSVAALSGVSTGSTSVPIGTASNGNGGFNGGVNSIALSPDGQVLLALGGSENAAGSVATLLYPVATAGLKVGALRQLGNSTPGGPQDIAVTPDQAPVADLSPASGTAGVPVTLNASSSNVTYGNIASYQWNFGDGSPATLTPSPTVSHTYASQGSYTATVTETDSAGTSLPPAPSAPGAVNGPGTTPYLRADSSARKSAPVLISRPGTPPPPLPTTTTSTTKPAATGSHAVLMLDQTVGSPGTIVRASGHGFPPNKSVKVTWSTNTASFTETTDGHGNLPAHELDILTPDVLGPRLAVATAGPGPALAQVGFLVVPGTAKPGGEGAWLFRSEGT